MLKQKIDQIHLKAPGNWINDPNGFIYFNGEYHLFYQHFPYGPRWGTMHWGHAVSKDLTSWEHQEIALFPSQYADKNGCFSGSAIEEDGKLYLFYTGVRYEIVNPKDIHSCLCDAFESTQLMIHSEDGYHFDNFKGKTIIIPPIQEATLGDRTHTRDPKVWKGHDGAWYLIIGSTTKQEGGKLLFYRSDNLKDWQYVNQVSKNNTLGWMWECPDLFEVDQHEVLIFSPMGLLKDTDGHENQAICMLVDFDETTCQLTMPDDYQFLDYGLDLYAPQSTTDAKGRRVVIAWARMPESVDNKWNGLFCMPRLVEVENQHIYFRLHPHLKEKFCKEIQTVDEANKAGYHIQIELENNETITIGGYQISKKNHKLYADRTQVCPVVPHAAMQFETPEIKEGNRLDIYVDENLIEIYINDGEYTMTHVVYNLTKEIETNSKNSYKLFTTN